MVPVVERDGESTLRDPERSTWRYWMSSAKVVG